MQSLQVPGGQRPSVEASAEIHLRTLGELSRGSPVLKGCIERALDQLAKRMSLSGRDQLLPTIRALREAGSRDALLRGIELTDRVEVVLHRAENRGIVDEDKLRKSQAHLLPYVDTRVTEIMRLCDLSEPYWLAPRLSERFLHSAGDPRAVEDDREVVRNTANCLRESLPEVRELLCRQFLTWLTGRSMPNDLAREGRALVFGHAPQLLVEDLPYVLASTPDLFSAFSGDELSTAVAQLSEKQRLQCGQAIVSWIEQHVPASSSVPHAHVQALGLLREAVRPETPRMLDLIERDFVRFGNLLFALPAIGLDSTQGRRLVLPIFTLLLNEKAPTQPEMVRALMKLAAVSEEPAAWQEWRQKNP